MDTSLIRTFLDDTGRKQVWLSKQLNISTSYLSLILSGLRVPPDWFESKVSDTIKHHSYEWWKQHTHKENQ